MPRATPAQTRRGPKVVLPENMRKDASGAPGEVAFVSRLWTLAIEIVCSAAVREIRDVAKNYIERSSVKQFRQLGSVAVLQNGLVRNPCFPCRALRDIQHRWRGIQQRDVNAKSCQANGGRSRAAPEIKCTQRRFGLQGKKIFQVAKCQVGAQSTLDCLKVRRIILRTVLESFVDGHGGYFCTTATYYQQPA